MDGFDRKCWEHGWCQTANQVSWNISDDIVLYVHVQDALPKSALSIIWRIFNFVSILSMILIQKMSL
jgi:hypothetical protein